MNYRTLLAIGLACALGACGKTIPPNEFDPDRGVVFSETHAVSLTFKCGERLLVSDGTWTPTANDVARLEAKLAPLLAEKLSALPPGGEKRTVVAYYRQYGGLLVGGTPIIYINGFRENRVILAPDRNQWRRDPVTVCGRGGEWYFTALYDPQTDAIGNFEFSP